MAGQTATPTRAPATAPTPEAVRVVLFGMRDAGKTSLLGAFAQAAERQAAAMHLHVRDVPEALDQVRRQVYGDGTRETVEQIVPYPVRIVPAHATPFDAMLYDCDGGAANRLLSNAQLTGRDDRAGRLARAVLDADALVLAVDASADAHRLDADFREFKRFLHLLQNHRAEGRQVGGLPVFLVLTKCDRLAEPAMTETQWRERVDERQNAVTRRFKEFMEDVPDEEDPYYSFGSLDLDVAATAIRHPRLRHEAAQPDDPVGVAELFGHCLEEAVRFRERTVHGRRRLAWTVAGSLGLLTVLAVGAVVFSFSTPDRRPELLRKIEAYQGREGRTPEARLSVAADLPERLAELNGFLADPDFANMPAEAQSFVRSRQAELKTYLAFADEVRAIPRPRQARSLAELARVQEAIDRAAVPARYRTEWAQTEAVRYRDRLVAEAAVLRNAVSDLRAFYLKLRSRATDLLFSPEVNGDWDRRYRRLLAEAGSPPAPESEPVRRTAFAFDETVQAQKEWLGARDRLAQLDDLASALGLIGDPTGPRAPLAPVPGEPPGAADVERQAAARLANLRKFYPEHPSWSLDALPDPVRPQVSAQVRRSLDRVVRDGQRIALADLNRLNPTGPEAPSDWPKIANTLSEPGLHAWRDLGSAMSRLLNPSAPDPVTAFADFVRKPSFDLELRKLRLTVPDNLRDARLRPAGPVTVYHRAAGTEDPTAALTFRQTGEPLRAPEGSVTYTFHAEGGNGRLAYRPGDALWAELRLKEGDRDWQFTWSKSRSASYQFERLTREPVLHDPSRPDAPGESADGVTLTVTDGKLPPVPALLPPVSFDRK